MPHPNIVAFWENAGYSLKTTSDWYSIDFFITLKDGYPMVIAVLDKEPDNNTLHDYYYLDRYEQEPYTEEEMLRLIKLKTFL